MIWKNKKTQQYTEAFEIEHLFFMNGTIFVQLKGRKSPIPFNPEVAEDLDLQPSDVIAFPQDSAATETFDPNFIVFAEDEFKKQHELVGTHYSGAIH